MPVHDAQCSFFGKEFVVVYWCILLRYVYLVIICYFLFFVIFGLVLNYFTDLHW